MSSSPRKGENHLIIDGITKSYVDRAPKGWSQPELYEVAHYINNGSITLSPHNKVV